MPSFTDGDIEAEQGATWLQMNGSQVTVTPALKGHAHFSVK